MKTTRLAILLCAAGLFLPCAHGQQTEALRKHFLETKAKAELGDSQAQNELGFIYDTGEGVEKNVSEALNWYRKAAGPGGRSIFFGAESLAEHSQAKGGRIKVFDRNFPSSSPRRCFDVGANFCRQDDDEGEREGFAIYLGGGFNDVMPQFLEQAGGFGQSLQNVGVDLLPEHGFCGQGDAQFAGVVEQGRETSAARSSRFAPPALGVQLRCRAFRPEPCCRGGG